MKNEKNALTRQSAPCPSITAGSPRSQPEGSQHTPGPWTVEEQWAHDCDGKPFMYAFWIADADGAQLAASVLNRVDAHLFAAAPDLLAAVRELVACWDGTRDMIGARVKAKLERGEAAIAKAEGR